jgi:phosphoribosyl 1,2-cyclic phosphodiesterase
MRFASLGSGSGGNALVLEVKQTRVLLDCGFGLRDMVRRLARVDLVPEDLAGILVTHEHADHVGGVVKLARKFNLAVPHDAREPAQYVLGDGAKRLGVLTDTGCATTHIEATLSGCDALVLECNHDVRLLRDGPYPPGLKKRVASRFGHLDNEASADLLAKLDQSRLQNVIAAHLSRQNNTPALAQGALARALNCAADWIGVADEEAGFGWRQVA